MTKFYWKYLPVLVIFMLGLALAPVSLAQEQGSTAVFSTSPEGADYTVDGQYFQQPTTAIWPAGSKHTLWVPPLQLRQSRTRFNFNGWFIGEKAYPDNPLVVTANAAYSTYVAKFDLSYSLAVALVSCPDPANCSSPGTVSVGGAPIISSNEVYVGAGSAVVVTATPNTGYVFLGWQPGANQVIVGLTNTVTMNGPVTVYPIFKPARKINLVTDPPGLSVLADRGLLTTPATLEWGMGTVHMLGANSPQKDVYGNYYAFQSWSDKGDINHAYTVETSSMPATVTATYVSAALVTVLTQPVGLKVKVDGQFYNVLNPNFFAWGVGEKHHLEAAAQQTDAQGRVWQFSSWSNGGSASQDITVPPEALTDGMRVTAIYTPLTKLTVTSSLPGLSVIVDGTPCATPCETVRVPGTQVKVSAPASVPRGEGSRADFDGWPGAAGDLVVKLADSPVTVNAGYHLLNRLALSSDPPNGAVWTLQPAAADGYYPANGKVVLSLATQPGYKFRRWEGDLSGTIPSGVVTMSAPRSVKAVFDTVPYLEPAGVVNAAGTTPQTGVAAGSIVAIFGANLTTETAVAPDGMLPQTLASVTVTAGGRMLPLFFASPGQVNAQIPDDLAEGDYVLAVTPTGAAQVRAPLKVVRNAPGLFPVAVDGKAMALAVHEDGSAVTVDAPAKPGELLTLYGTGFGPTERPRPEGMPIPKSPAYAIVDSVTVQVGELSLAAKSAFAVVGRCGVDAVQFKLDGSVTGTVTLRVTVNGVDSNTLLLPVQ